MGACSLGSTSTTNSATRFTSTHRRMKARPGSSPTPFRKALCATCTTSSMTAWENCLWIFTGDNGDECRILRASCDLKTVETVMAGNQQARAVAAVATAEGVYFASDTPLEANHVYRLSRDGTLATLADLDSSCIEGCLVGETAVFSTMVEPSAANPSRLVSLYAGREPAHGGTSRRGPKMRGPCGSFNTATRSCPLARIRRNTWQSPRLQCVAEIL